MSLNGVQVIDGAILDFVNNREHELSILGSAEKIYIKWALNTEMAKPV
jgi:hypothetical protein